MHFRSCKDLGVLNAVGGEYGGRMAKVKIFMELDGIFHEINQPFWIPPFMETPIYEEQPMFRNVPGCSGYPHRKMQKILIFFTCVQEWV